MMNHYSGLLAKHWEQNYALCNPNVNAASSATFISLWQMKKNKTKSKKTKQTLGAMHNI